MLSQDAENGSLDLADLANLVNSSVVEDIWEGWLENVMEVIVCFLVYKNLGLCSGFIWLGFPLSVHLGPLGSTWGFKKSVVVSALVYTTIAINFEYLIFSKCEIRLVH